MFSKHDGLVSLYHSKERDSNKQKWRTWQHKKQTKKHPRSIYLPVLAPTRHWSHRSHSLGQQTRPAIVVFTPTYSDAHFGETHLECLLAHLVVRTHSRRNTRRLAGNTNRGTQYATCFWSPSLTSFRSHSNSDSQFRGTLILILAHCKALHWMNTLNKGIQCWQSSARVSVVLLLCYAVR